MALPPTLAAAPLGLERELLVDLAGLERGDPRRDGGHAVLAGRHRHVALGAGAAVADLLAVGVERSGEGRDGIPPAPRPRAVEIGEPLPQLTVHLTREIRVEDRGGIGDGIGGVAADLSRAHRGEHARQRLHQTLRRGDRAARPVRGAAGDERDVLRGDAVRRLIAHRAGGLGRALVRCLVPCGGVPLPTGDVPQRDDGPRLERVERPETFLQGAEQVGEVAAGPALQLEHRPGVPRELPQQDGEIPERLGERRRPGLAQRIEERLWGELSPRARQVR